MCMGSTFWLALRTGLENEPSTDSCPVIGGNGGSRLHGAFSAIDQYQMGSAFTVAV
jgi:hypothetical protein